MAISSTISGAAVSRSRCHHLLAQLVAQHEAGGVAKAPRIVE